MTNEEIEALHRDLPEAVLPTESMAVINEPIQFYKGRYELRIETYSFELDGTMYFSWVPNSGSYFKGIVLANPTGWMKATANGANLKIFVDNKLVGEGFITSNTFGGSSETSAVKGVFRSSAIIGDTSNKVDRVNFSVVNFRSFYGDAVCWKKSGSARMTRGRICLVHEDVEIVLDKVVKFKEVSENLNETGGYSILAGGQISFEKRQVEYKVAQEAMNALSIFLSFANARKTSTLFAHGFQNGVAKWKDYSSYQVDAHKSVISWLPQDSPLNLNAAWVGFNSIWSDDEGKAFLTSVVHWFTTVNGGIGYSEGGLVIAQVGLELIFNWWIVERLQRVTPRAGKKLAAAKKLEMILAEVSVSSEIPSAFTDLKTFFDGESELTNAPETIVLIRNAIMHSRKSKREKLAVVSTMARYQATQLSIWYIELAILKIIGHNGIYFNRCSGSVYAYKAEMNVPWYTPPVTNSTI